MRFGKTKEEQIEQKKKNVWNEHDSEKSTAHYDEENYHLLCVRIQCMCLGPMCLVATILDSTDIEHFQHRQYPS